MSDAFMNVRGAIRDFEDQLKAGLDVLFKGVAKAVPSPLFLSLGEPAEDTLPSVGDGFGPARQEPVHVPEGARAAPQR
jgi:hypothetical protein